MISSSFGILEKFSESLIKFSDRTAFFIKGTSYTYLQFQQRISAIQQIIKAKIPEDEKYIGILTFDHPDTYASIFALWCSGKAFVPLNALNPPERNHLITSQMGLKHILSASDQGSVGPATPGMVINTFNFNDSQLKIELTGCPPEADAYVLFTSGSTGRPKGVRISRRNLDAFYRAYLDFGPEYTHEDRFLQVYDISFDGSVPCYLIPLCAGASVYTVPQDEIKYLYGIKLMMDHQLTVVKLTPSILYFIRPYFNRLFLPSVRCCLFGGEALPLALTEEWMKCVPNAVIQNVYGPTEATIDSLIYNFNMGDFQKKAKEGVVSLGKNFGDFEYAVICSSGAPVEDGEPGELCLCSSQVMNGYWNDEEKTANAFIPLETTGGIKKFYKTGDLVSRDTDGFFMYHGRIDNQVQIQGYRVELGEIEKYAGEISSGSNLVAVEARGKIGNPEIVLFIEGDRKPAEPIISHLRSKLPQYMIPSGIIFMKELPQLSSGKTDRKKLFQLASENGEK